MRFFAFASLFFWAFAAGIGNAADLAIINGRILDLTGKPAAGAEVQVFDSADVRRPADYISGRTGVNGKYQVKLPPGRYWLVAISRGDGRRFGPLGTKDKHSGTPLVDEVEAGESIEQDFTILSLREAALRQRKRNETLVRVSGRIFAAGQTPAAMACALADRKTRPGAIPAYVSAYTDKDGNYLLFMPKGDYYFGAILGFPPPSGYLLKEKRLIDKDIDGLDLTLPGNLKNQENSEIGR